MPFELTEELIEEALSNPEIQSGAVRAGLTKDFLKSRVKAEESNILEAAVNQIGAHDSLESDYYEAQYRIWVLQERLANSRVRRGVKWLAVLMIAVGLAVVALDLILGRIFQRSLIGGLHLSLLDIVFLGIYVLITAVAVSTYYWLSRQARVRLAAARTAAGLDEFPDIIEQSKHAVREAIIYYSGILPELLISAEIAKH